MFLRRRRFASDVHASIYAVVYISSPRESPSYRNVRTANWKPLRSSSCSTSELPFSGSDSRQCLLGTHHLKWSRNLSTVRWISRCVLTKSNTKLIPINEVPHFRLNCVHCVYCCVWARACVYWIHTSEWLLWEIRYRSLSTPWTSTSYLPMRRLSARKCVFAFVSAVTSAVASKAKTIMAKLKCISIVSFGIRSLRRRLRL